MSGALLLTGGTGFLGMELIARLLEDDDGPELFLLVRDGRDGEAEARAAGGAERRLAELLARLYDERPAAAARLHPVAGELTAPRLGLADDDRRALQAQVTHVIHCAASISFSLPLALARDVNVTGTQRVLELSSTLPRLERFVHVSTAYVAGRTPSLFSEDDVGGSDFRNTYEQTKLEAELAVAAAGLPAAIVRPSIVVGEADSGWTSAFNVLYWPLQAFARGLLQEVPADPAGIVDMVPVDHVAEVIERVAFTPGLDGRFHAVAAERALTVAELIESVCTELEREPPLLTAPGSLPDDHPAAVFAPYFDIATRFDDRRASALVGPAPEPRTYLRRLLDYGNAARWGKRALTRESARLAAAPH